MLKIISSITLTIAISLAPILVLAKITNIHYLQSKKRSKNDSFITLIALSAINIAIPAKVSRSYHNLAFTQMNRRCKSENAECSYLLHVQDKGRRFSYYVKDKERSNEGHYLCSFKFEDVRKPNAYHDCISHHGNSNPFGYDEIENILRNVVYRKENIKVLYFFPTSDAVVFVGQRNGKTNLYYIPNQKLREHAVGSAPQYDNRYALYTKEARE